MKRVLLVLGATLFALIGSAGFAFANQTVHYPGLLLKSGTTTLSEIDTTTDANNLFQKINNDADGDRMHVQAPWRDRAPGNGNSVYVRVDWSKNGTFCYVSGISQGGASVGCSSGWNGYGQSKSTHIQDSGWWFYNPNKPYDQLSNSIRAAVMTCEDHSFAGDPCSGSRFGGISYN